MLIDQDETLHEIMGTFTGSGTAATVRPAPTGTGSVPVEHLIRTGVRVRNCNTLDSWQQNIVRSLERGRDQYVIARPGGGKTLPIICYWADNIFNFNAMMRQRFPNISNEANIRTGLTRLFRNDNKSDIGRILIMVPVIALANQTADEIRTDLASVMMQWYNYHASINAASLLDLMAFESTSDRELNVSTADLTARRDVISELSTLSPNETSRRNSLTRVLMNMNKNITEQAENYIRVMVNRYVHVRTGSSRSGDANRALVYITIYESSNELLKSLPRTTNFSLLVIDEAHLAQQSGSDIEDQSRSYQIAGGIYDVLDDRRIRNNNNMRMILITGTINPRSAAAFTNYLNSQFRRNFENIVVAPESAANRSQLSVIRNESIGTRDGIVNAIIRSVNQRAWGQLFVLFSSKEIHNIITDCIDKIGSRNIEVSDPQGYQFQNTFSNLGRDREEENAQQRSSLSLGSGALNRMKVPPGVSRNVANITNPLLRQAVLRGIGFIHRTVPGDSFSSREDERVLRMDDRDKTIVAQLFKERKLHVLLATDAVGIGVNIDVKDLYIPKVTKYTPSIRDHAVLTLRDLSQILNRAGRGSTPIAAIHTTGENMEIVQNALFAGPDDFPEVGVNQKITARHTFSEIWRRYRER